MADDSGQNVAPAEIDLDNIEVVVVIICKNVSHLNSAGTFLTRRGWPTTVVSDISRGIELISEKKPDFILISLSHPSPAVSRLPDLITQSFNIPCIGFLESSDATTVARFNQSRLRFKIQGQPSGPTIYRTIRKILAERFQLEANEKAFAESATAMANAGPEIFRFKNEGQDNNDPGVIIQKSSADATVGQGANIIRGEGADGDEAPAAVSNRPRISLKAIEKLGGDGRAASDMLFGKDLAVAPESEKFESNEELVGRLKESLFGENGEDLTVVLQAEKNNVKPRKSDQSLLEKAVEAAINRHCQTIPDVEPEPLEEVTLVGVFPVVSASQPGYLVVVWQAPDISAREEFLRGCEREIESALKVMGFDGRTETAFWVQLPGVDFIPWSEAHASFRFLSAHQKREVGVAFFPTTTVGKRPEPAPGEDRMYSLPLEEISTDQPVNFKAFVRLGESGRYVMYIRAGRTLQPEQKERLKAHNIDRIYMNADDLENHRQYVATNYLLSLIFEFKKVA